MNPKEMVYSYSHLRFIFMLLTKFVKIQIVNTVRKVNGYKHHIIFADTNL